MTVIAIKPKAGWPAWRKPGTRRFPLLLFSQELLALLEAGLLKNTARAASPSCASRGA